jgi:hypothetical protein
MQVDIARNCSDTALDGLRGLVARRGAQIEESLAGMKIEERHNGLRSNILDASGARDVGLGRLKEGGRNLVRCCATKLAIPSFEQPRGHGEIGGAVRPRHQLAVGFSQNGIDQSSRCFVSPLHQLHAFADSGMRRDAIQIAELINAHAQRDTDFGIGRTRDAASDQIIELGLIAETPEDDLGGEAGIARVELSGALEQQVGSIATLVDFAENVESDLARGRDQVLF